MLSLEEETRDTYEALKEARDVAKSKFPFYTIETFNGEVHEGVVPHGTGFIASCMEFQYVGELNEGQLVGTGKTSWANGYKVVGQFAEGVPNGKGSIQWPNGDIYEGDLVNGVRHGFGKLTSHKGKAVYEGMWYRSRRHGEGMQIYTDGSVYVGFWEHDFRHGRGTITYAEKDCYEGEWNKNCRHGTGSMGWKHGTENFLEMYDGEWDNGIPHGKGVSTYIRLLDESYRDSPNVTPLSYSPPIESVLNVYRGNFNRGQRDGFGTFYYADGSAYEGEWKNNRKMGRGKFITHNGAVIVDEFVDDETTHCNLNHRDPELVPKVLIDDICGIPDGTFEQLNTTIQSLLLRFNTPLRAMFTAYSNQWEDIALAFTPNNWWKHRLPSRISIPQFLRLLSDKHVLHCLVSIATVVQCIITVIEREFRKNEDGEKKEAKMKANIYRLKGSLNYRQFAETIIRLAPKVCVGPKYYELGKKFDAFVTEILIHNRFSEPLCIYSREYMEVIQPHLPSLEAKFNALVNLKLDSTTRVLVVRDFLQFVAPLLKRRGIHYPSAIAEIFPVFRDVHGPQLPPGYNQPQSDLSVAVFHKGCGENNESLIAGVSVEQELTVVDFVEALVVLAVRLAELPEEEEQEIMVEGVLEPPTMEKILTEEILELQI